MFFFNIIILNFVCKSLNIKTAGRCRPQRKSWFERVHCDDVQPGSLKSAIRPLMSLFNVESNLATWWHGHTMTNSQMGRCWYISLCVWLEQYNLQYYEGWHLRWHGGDANGIQVRLITTL